MDANAARILAAVIGLVGAAIGAWGTSRYLADKIEDLSREATAYQSRANAAEERLASLEPELIELQSAFSELEEDYGKCIDPTGSNITASSLDSGWKKATARTGDSIEFRLAYSSAYLRVARVTTDGPIMKLEGCDKSEIFEGYRAPSRDGNAFRLPRHYSQELLVSSDCCEKGLHSCDMRDLEKIEIEALSFDSDEQRTELRYRKTYEGD